MTVPESIGVQYTVAVSAELIPGRDGHAIAVPVGVSTAAVKLAGSPGEVMTVFARGADMTFQIGPANVQAKRASNAVPRGTLLTFTLGGTVKNCTHIAFFGLDDNGEAIVNFYRRGS